MGGDILVLTYALYPLWVVPRVKMQHWRLTICIVWTLQPALGVKAPQIILHTLRRCAIDVSPIKSTAFELQRLYCNVKSKTGDSAARHRWGDRVPLVSTAGCFDLSRLHTSHSFAENQFIPNLYSTPEWAPTVLLLASVADKQEHYCAFWSWMFQFRRTKEELCKANGTFVDDMQKSHVFRCVPTPMSHRAHGNTL